MKPAFLLLVALAPFALRAQDDVRRQLADTQDKLSTALRSYSLLEDENAKLKQQLDKDASDRAALQARIDADRQQVAELRAAAAAAAQLDGLREQLRQARDEVASLGQENYELKRRLALAGSPRSP